MTPILKVTIASVVLFGTISGCVNTSIKTKEHIRYSKMQADYKVNKFVYEKNIKIEKRIITERIELARVKSLKSFNLLQEKVIEKESGGDKYIVNSLGYMGLYQFGTLALKDIGMKNINKNEFLENEYLQHRAFEQLLINNARYLRNYTKYIGKNINGVTIDTSSLLLGAHLVGAKQVKRFLKSNGSYIPTDANNVSVVDYMKLFHGYSIDIKSLKGIQQ